MFTKKIGHKAEVMLIATGKWDPTKTHAVKFVRPTLQKLCDLFHQACPDVKDPMKWSFPDFEYKALSVTWPRSEAMSPGFWKAKSVSESDDLLEHHWGLLMKLLTSWVLAVVLACVPSLSAQTPKHRNLRSYAYSVAFSPDGRTLASGTYEAIYLWDTATGRQSAALKGHTGIVSALAFSTDGKTLLSGSGFLPSFGEPDKTARLWDLATGKNTSTVMSTFPGFGLVAYEPEGRALAADKTGLWDVAVKKKIAAFPKAPPAVRYAITPDGTFLPTLPPTVQAVISPNGKTVAFIREDGTVPLWDTATRSIRVTLKGHNTERVIFGGDGKRQIIRGPNTDRVVFSPDGKRLASASTGTVTFHMDAPIEWHGVEAKVWEVRTGKELASWPSAAGISALAFSSDGKTLAIANEDHSIRLWDLDSRKNTVTIGGIAEVHSLAFSPDGKTLASGATHSIRLYDLTAGPDPSLLTGNRTVFARKRPGSAEFYSTHGFVDSMAFSAEGKSLMVALQGGIAQHWSLADGKLIGRCDPPAKGPAVALTPDGKSLAVGDEKSGKIKLFDIATGRNTVTLEGHTFGQKPFETTRLAFSSDARMMASLADDVVTGRAELMLWDLLTGKRIARKEMAWRPRKPLDEISASPLAFTPDGKDLALEEDRLSGPTVNLSELPSLKFVRHLGQIGRLKCWAFRRDGRELAMGGGIGGFLNVNEAIADSGDDAPDKSVKPTPKAKASPDKDTRKGIIKLWDVANAKEMATISGHNADVSAVAFSADGKLLASGDEGGLVKIWDATSRKDIAILDWHMEMITCLVFSRDGRILAAACRDGTIKLWDVPGRRTR